MNTFHTSVLLEEAVHALHVTPGKRFVDGTLGGGGHTSEILQKGGEVLGIDRDENAIGYVTEIHKTAIAEQRLRLVKGNFSELETIVTNEDFFPLSGILLDLGVSSYQFDTSERGFSFMKEAQLDMRMDRALNVTAKDLVNGLTKLELKELFEKLGEERFARIIADVIVRKREKRPIETTSDLADLIKYAVPRGKNDIHPATRVFQALRIAVNDELNALRSVLPQAVKILEHRGRLVVISFHSLEDRIVKQAFMLFESEGLGSIVTRKPLVPKEDEAQNNPRARSAKLRIFEKLG